MKVEREEKHTIPADSFYYWCRLQTQKRPWDEIVGVIGCTIVFSLIIAATIWGVAKNIF